MEERYTKKTTGATASKEWTGNGGGGVSDNVRCSSWAHWKALNGLLISVKWTFLL